jgi:hypothetical protein
MPRLLLLALSIAAVTPVATPQAGTLSVQAIGIMSRAPRTGPVSGSGEIQLAAARNEWAPFQVVVSSTDELSVVDVQVPPFRGRPNGIRAVIYRETFIQVTEPTPFSPYPPGWYPDALIPAHHPTTGEPLGGLVYDAVPFSLPASANQPLWIDLHVPTDTTPGVYRSAITVSAGAEKVTLPVTLTVWAFTLPETPTLRSSFWMADYQMDTFYGLSWDTDAAALYQITRRYYDVLPEHRLMPTRPVDTQPVTDSSTGRPVYDAVYPGLDSVLDNLRHYLDDNHASAINIPLRSWWPFAEPLTTDREQAIQWVSDILALFAEHGWQDAPYAYLFDLDEPNTADAYDLVRQWGVFFDEIEARTGRSIPMLVTEHPIPDDPDWGSLVGSVDIWVPCCDTVWWSDDHLGESVVADRLAAGDEVWWYTALAGASGPWWPEHGYPTVIAGDNAPIWQIDYPPLNYRIAPWFADLYGFTGILYWHVACWSADPWNDPLTYRTSNGYGYNGEGMLVYPGRADEIGFDGPVPSIRLKWLREGMEDHTYLTLLRRAGESAFVADQLERVARTMGDWEEDPAMWIDARQALGERLHAIATSPRRAAGRAAR